jgi:hypothetical protein
MIMVTIAVSLPAIPGSTMSPKPVVNETGDDEQERGHAGPIGRNVRPTTTLRSDALADVHVIAVGIA